MAKVKKTLMRKPQVQAVERTSPPPGAGSSAGGSTTSSAAHVPDPEVPPRAVRRTFTAEYKGRVLEEADACTEPGEIGALLRRHGLYSSHLTSWRQKRADGVLAGLAPRRRGRKGRPKNPLVEEVARLERENKKLLAHADRAERLVELQERVAELLGDPLPPAPLELEPESEARPVRARRRR
ncbi:MAG: hypothetical protein HY720_29025 [Planctomycetes bacterium]|nr:hypothetical protein [Planctomycetota bacterium]